MAVPQPAELADAFQNEAIHSGWKAAYRQSRLQDRLNEKLMNRFLHWLDVPPGGTILDAGCGTGEHTCRIASRGYHCVGVDISQPALVQAATRAGTMGLHSNTTFIRSGLEDLTALDQQFDGIHCRGVLMHIPRFLDALGELCRVLKPGGRILLTENNHRSIEAALVRGIRRLRRGNSEMTQTPGGLEFYTREQNEAPLTRIANLRALQDELSTRGVKPVGRFATEFWDILRFRPGLLRNGAIVFNYGWHSLRLPAALSMGNAIVGEKSA